MGRRRPESVSEKTPEGKREFAWQPLTFRGVAAFGQAWFAAAVLGSAAAVMLARALQQAAAATAVVLEASGREGPS